jgi:hypothetical protein
VRGRGQGKHRDGNPCADAERGDQSGQETLNALARLPIYRVIVHLEITRMTLSPKDALEAAKLKRAQNQAAQEQQNAQQLAFPALAEQRLQEIEARLKAETPSELRLETQYNAAGDMDNRSGRRGVKGLNLKLYEGQKLIAAGQIGIASDQSVELLDYTRDNKGKKFKATTFAYLDGNFGVQFLSHLITTHIA